MACELAIGGNYSVRLARSGDKAIEPVVEQIGASAKRKRSIQLNGRKLMAELVAGSEGRKR